MVARLQLEYSAVRYLMLVEPARTSMLECTRREMVRDCILCIHCFVSKLDHDVIQVLC